MTAREIYERGSEDGTRPKRSTTRSNEREAWITGISDPQLGPWPGLGLGLGLGLSLGLRQRLGMTLRGLDPRNSEEDGFRTPFFSLLETSQSAIDPVLLDLQGTTVSATRAAK
jgi:hypothetical protein